MRAIRRMVLAEGDGEGFSSVPFLEIVRQWRTLCNEPEGRSGEEVGHGERESRSRDIGFEEVGIPGEIAGGNEDSRVRD